MPYKPDHINNLRDKLILEKAQHNAKKARDKEKAEGIPVSASRHIFFKKAFLKLGNMSPLELTDYTPKTCIELMMKNAIFASGRDGAVAITVLREMRDISGERQSKFVKGHEKAEQPKIVNDLPFADLPPLRVEDDKTSN